MRNHHLPYKTDWLQRSLICLLLAFPLTVHGSINKDVWSPDAPEVFEFERLGSSGTDYVNESDNGTSSDNTFYFDARLDYSRTFGDHSVSGMLMYMQREYRSGVRPNRLQGFSGRFTYDYQHKYLAEFNFGYNGTERLAKGDRSSSSPPCRSDGWPATRTSGSRCASM